MQPPARPQTEGDPRDDEAGPLIAAQGISWAEANLAAMSRGGYLATVRSLAENQFVFTLAKNAAYWSVGRGDRSVGPWLGGLQPAGSAEPGGNWQWLTGEPFTSSFWSEGEPNNLSGEEHYLSYYSPVPGSMSASWNDVPLFDPPYSPNAYVVEYGRLEYRTCPYDFDGDGRTDIAVWRGYEGTWNISRSSDGSSLVRAWGTQYAGDVPVPGDYDGDGRTDIAVWRPYEGNWYICKSSENFSGADAAIVQPWGTRHAGDVPVPGDYDGDGITDVAAWRAPQGAWYVLRSGDGGLIARRWGNHWLGDEPVPGDYDGDGKADMAVWRGFEGTWSILWSSDGSTLTRAWGTRNAGDIAVPGDYDGDGKTDIAVWRSYEGYW